MTKPGSTPDVAPAGHPYRVEVDAERQGLARTRPSRPVAHAGGCLVPGYYRDPDWTLRDVVAHLGTWLAETQVQFERIGAGTYEGHDVDVDALNAALLAGMAGQPWEVAWVQAQAARTWMLEAWYALTGRSRATGRFSWGSAATRARSGRCW